MIGRRIITEVLIKPGVSSRFSFQLFGGSDQGRTEQRLKFWGNSVEVLLYYPVKLWLS